jgi:tetratricopeptide (TPR) repeat protein
VLARSSRLALGIAFFFGVGHAASAADRAAFRDSPQGRSIIVAAKMQPAEQTYQQLVPLEPAHAGEVEFDYLLGTSALDAGHASAAVFALQRAVSTAPSFSGARLELARAYYAAGDNESARREFEILQGEDPPPAVRAAIAQYLEAIDRRSAAYRPRFTALIEAGGGYDTNANGATADRQFAGFDLNERSTEQSTSYYGVAAAGQGSYPLTARWRLLGDGSVQQRNYPEASFVNSSIGRIGAGMEWTRDTLRLAAIVSDTFVALDSERNNNSAALDLSSVYGFADDWQAALNARIAAIRFVEELSAQDVDSFLASTAITRTWNGTPQVQIAAAITGGRERAKEETSPFGRDLVGARLSAFFLPRATVVTSASVAVLRSEYDGAFFSGEIEGGGSFALFRDDTQYSARISADFRDFPAPRWSIGTHVTYIDNRSSVSLFEYDRIEAGVMVRREFR